MSHVKMRRMEMQGARPPAPPEGAKAKAGEAHADCWAFAVARIRAMSFGRVNLPDDFAEAMRSKDALCVEVPAGRACVRGDLLEMVWTHPDGQLRRHVAVCVDAFRAVHFVRGRPEQGGGVLEMEISLARRTGSVTGVMRIREWVERIGGSL
jgi:hypothetical protein